VWSNTNEGQGYDLVLMAQMDPQTIDVDAIQAKLDSPEYAAVAKSLREIGMNSAVDLFSTYAGRKSDLAPWLKDASLNRDRNLRLQYLAGLGLNEYKADEIYQDMLRFVHTTPQDLFAGSEQTRYLLFSKIRNAQGW
jgi:spermidine synthase